jgi:hypothetical protein
LDDLVVTKAQNVEARGLQAPIASRVVIGLRLVHGPVHFNHQAGGVAVEVHDEPADDLLATKVEAVQAIGAQGVPQALFGRRRIAAQGASAHEPGGVDFPSGDKVRFGHRVLFAPPSLPGRGPGGWVRAWREEALRRIIDSPLTLKR